uniref:Uncharacterized protein n=1 Tax=Eucampia antarctica TaxID=49252 RepID=A0A7S2R475_9STRA|mmetsp:Transcript_16161/g.15596  ORF Transcript_16161/g.15596 Transcript_16161/m.15596 type:complete len:229 (+) Transcript_16161:53-739(+)|eukprot:CAMPEP_0197831954 /NCGR_PEP_ID=MMETSP1437-20131217/12867_1 /TAXON_ID=49252 ORGANISM="Eucampia antarctica, Strain CCMP1452" /NCGR_SAMPLE_ID=MMETSP1437 /ASSEMBLY_ACC=CAM_ASM_001096 /LENGTH=228 /DNA_ID=CAMNT_0043435107 /DNA_START=53 /DNA_END=739 /DNA_ORIENTATION=+
MKVACFLLLTASATSVAAFTPFGVVNTPKTALFIGRDGNVDLGGNSWKPDSEKMGSTDTGDYLPEGYDPEQEIAFSSGMMGSQGGSGDRSGPELPGMENLGADALMMGGIELSEDIPKGMEFIPSSIPDGEYSMSVSSTSDTGVEVSIDVAPMCMTFEDFFAAFSPDSNPAFSVEPATGRMDRRGGELSTLVVKCTPRGQSGDLVGNLVINLPEDNSKICYKITAQSF